MTHKWIIDKNVNSQNIIADFTRLISNRQSGFSLDELVHDSIAQGRTGDMGKNGHRGSAITIGVRLLQACFYMLGYKYDIPKQHVKGALRKGFMPSPMTYNILTTDNEIEKKKNFLVNLYSMQYPHPFNRTPDCFEIYIGRLLVKLLLDSRLEKRLYIDETIWFIPFLERLTPDIYESLVQSIIEFRSLSYDAKWALFTSIDDWESLFANVSHEMNYYFLRLFCNFGVLNIIGDANHNGGNLFRFRHTGQSYRNDAYKSRAKISGYICLNPEITEAAERLDNSFSAFDIPTKENDEYIANRQDWLTNIYEIEPLSYLGCINTSVDRKSIISETVTKMVHASKFGSRDGKEFEQALKPFIELFRETLDVEIISGAGNTDLLCTMEELPSYERYKMNVDAKTRNKALESIHPGRIGKHISKHGAKFCIVIAPKFALGVNDDIYGSKIVAIRSEELGTYCYHECTVSRDGYADFSSILNIIEQNPGTDITYKVRALTERRYGVTVSK